MATKKPAATFAPLPPPVRVLLAELTARVEALERTLRTHGIYE